MGTMVKDKNPMFGSASISGSSLVLDRARKLRASMDELLNPARLSSPDRETPPPPEAGQRTSVEPPG